MRLELHFKRLGSSGIIVLEGETQQHLSGYVPTLVKNRTLCKLIRCTGCFVYGR